MSEFFLYVEWKVIIHSKIRLISVSFRLFYVKS